MEAKILFDFLQRFIKIKDRNLLKKRFKYGGERRWKK